MPKLSTEKQSPLRIFEFHGLDLHDSGGANVTADCPFCGKEGGKFRVHKESGQFGCFVCGVEGNGITFIRQLWETGSKDKAPLRNLATERKLINADTVAKWGVAVSPITGEYLIPSFGIDGKLCQLAIRRFNKHISTPGLTQGLHGMPLFDPEKPCIAILEGCWDAMAMWEVLQATADTETNVLAVPGASVFHDRWLPLFKGKQVMLLYDSDHPKVTPTGTQQAGWQGMRRAARLLRTVTKDVLVLTWGEGGFDSSLPSGYDVRDWLTQGATLVDRAELWQKLLERVGEPPAEWFLKPLPKKREPKLHPLPCSNWSELTLAWRKALQWRDEMGEVLAVVLAVCLSTDQIGDQLFLTLIAEAGSATTRFCDAILVSKHCYPLEHLKGFHSGYQGKKEEAEAGEDFSLIARVNHKTMVTPEADVLISSPTFTEIMSQQRRIFDGTSGASYKNQKEDKRYTGLRTPWVMAGTPALMDTDQSRLGDRFLRVIINPPTEEEKKEILRRVGHSAIRSVRIASNCESDSHIEENLRLAYQLTGGYVDWLRGNASELLERIRMDEDWVVDRCATFAELTSDLRARPSKTKEEAQESKELPTRLTHQFVRLACCLAVVLNKKEVDRGVLNIVRKVALDTAKGRSLDIVRVLARKSVGVAGITSDSLSVETGHDLVTNCKLLNFMKRIKTIESFNTGPMIGMSKVWRWRLTARLEELWKEVWKDA